MNQKIKNDIAEVEISSLGAEVLSFKTLSYDCEYIWNGDKNYWPSHSPILFPIVCAVNEGKIKVDGKEYVIGNHGFAKKSEFTLLKESENSLTYQLSFDEETLKMYPYKFELNITYTLVESTLSVKCIVRNIDHQKIYFQIGTHPGFNCPISDNDNFEDYYLEFECKENLDRLFMNGSNVVINDKSETILKDQSVLPLTHQLFHNGALVFRNITSEKISLKSSKSDKMVILSYDNLPYLGLWQAKDAPFVCIEPWYGIADTEGFNGEFKEREMVIELDKDKAFECNYTIEIR